MDNKKNAPKVSAVLVNWNGPDVTAECMESLRKSDYPNLEVVAVDNASTDGSADKLEKLFPEMTVLRSKINRGWGGGTNVGLKYAMENGSDYIWLLNNDLVVEPDSLSKLVAAAEKTDEAVLVSPILYFYATRDKIQHCGSEFDWKNYVVRNISDLDEIASINEKDFWTWCTAVLMKREVVERTGYFDEKYFIYFDDLDYSARALSAGCRHKLETSAKVYHRSHSADTGGVRSHPLHYFYYQTRNEYWFWRERAKGLKRFVFFRMYLARLIRMLAYYQREGWDDIIEASLAGLYCGLRNIGGHWDKNIKMPRRWKNLIMNRPYFWVRLCEVNAGKVKDALLGRKKTFSASEAER
ncbi:MAG: glycosyltransferase family 2 protein [Phycisphaerae bacterium]|jgi:hypothetical protein